MNKKVLILLILILSFNSCLKGDVRTRLLNNSRDDEQADYLMELILDALKNKDKNTLREMFSKQSLLETDDINNGIEYLFDFFKGEVVSWERDGQIVSEKNDYGDKVKEVKTWYNIDTEKQRYRVFLLDYITYTGKPENVGLYALRVIKAEDEETQFTFWQDMKIPGIFQP